MWTQILFRLRHPTRSLACPPHLRCLASQRACVTLEGRFAYGVVTKGRQVSDTLQRLDLVLINLVCRMRFRLRRRSTRMSHPSCIGGQTLIRRESMQVRSLSPDCSRIVTKTSLPQMRSRRKNSNSTPHSTSAMRSPCHLSFPHFNLSWPPSTARSELGRVRL